jgi:hypothetical protein
MDAMSSINLNIWTTSSDYIAYHVSSIEAKTPPLTPLLRRGFDTSLLVSPCRQRIPSEILVNGFAKSGAGGEW